MRSWKTASGSLEVSTQMEMCMLGRDEDDAQIIHRSFLCLVFDKTFVFVTLFWL